MKNFFTRALGLLSLFQGVTLAQTGAQPNKLILYYDQWHPDAKLTAESLNGVTHVILAFMLSKFVVTPAAESFYSMTEQVTGEGWLWHMETKDKIKGINKDVKVNLAIGGWNDDLEPGFRAGMRNPTGFADNLLKIITDHEFDGADIDFEYPGGNAVDYLSNTSDKNPEIQGYRDLLQAIYAKFQPAKKELSIAIAGKPKDMVAISESTNNTAVWAYVDYVNVMTYDMMNRRDKITGHHSSFKDSSSTIDHYLSLGLPKEKAMLGLPFYAKWFGVAGGCDTKANPSALGCSTVSLEDGQGEDTDKSGSMTFESKNLKEFSNPGPAVDAKCGPGVEPGGAKCAGQYCCSTDGWCGDTAEHCGYGKCNPSFGRCEDGAPDLWASWREAQTNFYNDSEAGGYTYLDPKLNIFWTWDPVEYAQKKMRDIVQAKGLGGVMAWSFGEEDGENLGHINAMKAGISGSSPPASSGGAAPPSNPSTIPPPVPYGAQSGSSAIPVAPSNTGGAFAPINSIASSIGNLLISSATLLAPSQAPQPQVPQSSAAPPQAMSSPVVVPSPAALVASSGALAALGTLTPWGSRVVHSSSATPLAGSDAAPPAGSAVGGASTVWATMTVTQPGVCASA